jgi:CBS domain-containing protein
MWWPAMGGLVVGIGGLIFPQALGVGYDTIGAMLGGNVAITTIAGVLLVKSVIWAVSLGSGTSGGVLAPLLMMGGALGGVEATFLPNEGIGFWPLISMAAILGGTMRSPFTAIIFAVELMHDLNVLLPLLVASVLAHLFTVLVLKRSILTEKVSRRGFHLSREYSVDPLEILFVREVMRTNLVALPSQGSAHDVHPRKGQHLYPVVEPDRSLVGVVTRNQLAKSRPDSRLADLANPNPVVAYPDETLRVVVYRMAESGFTRMPVVDRSPERKLLGVVSLEDLLRARTRNLEEERLRERVLKIRLPFQPAEQSNEQLKSVSR